MQENATGTVSAEDIYGNEGVRRQPLKHSSGYYPPAAFNLVTSVKGTYWNSKLKPVII